MKKLYSKIFIFLLPVFLTWLGMEVFYRTVETNYSFKNEQVKEYYNNTEILILGSSHSYFGINPEHFRRKTYNFSNISQSLYFDELLLNKHLDSLSNLKAVVLTIGYFTLSQQDDSVEDSWRKFFYNQQMDLDVPIVSDYDIKKYSLALTRRFNKSFILLHDYIENGTIITNYPNGFGKQDSTDIVSNKELVSLSIARKHEDGSTDFEVNTERLERIIQYCEKRGVEVFLVEMPVYPIYYEALNSEKKLKVSTTLRSLASEYENTTHIKLSQHPDFTKNDLRDADHLTNEGATKCSKLLSELIEAKLLNN